MTDLFCAAEARLFDSSASPSRDAPAARRPRRRDHDPRDGQRRPGRLRPRQRHVGGATWASLLAHLPDRHAIALDSRVGRSDAYPHTGRPLPEHAVAQLTSALDALGLERAAIAGMSPGAMWALDLAPATRARRGRARDARVALPGLRPDPYFNLLTTPGLGGWRRTAPAPRSAAATRRACPERLGRRALEHTPDEFFERVWTGMARPGWGRAMWSHLNLAMRSGRARPENVFSDDELRSIATSVQLIWDDREVYGGPEIGERAAALLPDTRLELIEGGHAPFLDEPSAAPSSSGRRRSVREAGDPSRRTQPIPREPNVIRAAT
jgi:pimeloyl-ACP methyl ester carboxylesterase